MYCYKINNSYTIYVYTEYINSCVKASKKKKSSGKSKSNQPKCRQTRLVPIPLRAKVNHKMWGNGTLVEKRADGIMTVAFSDRLVKFLYPDAFTKGHLVRV